MFSAARASLWLAGAALTVTVAACGGGNSAGSTGSAPQAPPAVTASATLPAQPVCDVVAKELVSKSIGEPVLSSDDKDIMSAAGNPTLCNYYLDRQESRRLQVDWKLEKDDHWDARISALGKATDADVYTSRVTGLGDDAIRTTSKYEDITTVAYSVLLKDRGIVVTVTSLVNQAHLVNVSDRKLVELARAVIANVQKL